MVAVLAMMAGSHCATQPTNEDVGSRPGIADAGADTDASIEDAANDGATVVNEDASPDAGDDTAPSDQHCAAFSEATQTGKLEAAQIDEASGLAASWKHPGLLWTHNDSGDEARLFLIRPDGALVAEVELEGVDAIDWEDIAVGPCGANAADSCIYVGDTGDNLKKREAVAVYRFAEPDLPEGHLKAAPEPQASVTLKIETLRQIWFGYPEGPRDVETLMVHPASAAIYVVEKNETPDAPVFQVPNIETTREEPAQATQVGLLNLPGVTGLVAMVTAGDISPDGREFTIRTYLEAFTYCAPVGGELGEFTELFSATPVRRGMPLMVQSESLGYDLDGRSIWITSEGSHAPIYQVSRGDSAAGE